LTARLRARLHGDGGFTLTEMVVVMFILGIVLAAVQTTLLMTQKTVGVNNMRLTQTMQAKTAIEAMSRTLRTAVLPSQLNGTCGSCSTAAFIQGTANSVQFYANINNDKNIIGPSRVTYSVAGNGDLTETIQAPNAHAATDYNYQYCTPSATCVVPTRVLAHFVQTTKPLLTYYDKNGTVFTDTTLTAVELAGVDSIDLFLQVQAAANQTLTSTTLTERVTLPNADSVAQATATP
jgi:prepilin-type N-terminal cleavage/methylation domain-containing protein